MKVSQKEIYNYLISKGLSRNHALGIIANIKAESNFDVGILGDNDTSGGLFQHHDGKEKRFSQMKEFVGSDWETNWKGQIDFALQEDDGVKYINEPFDNPQEASEWFTMNFERPYSTIEKRKKEAEKRLDFFGEEFEVDEKVEFKDLEGKEISIKGESYLVNPRGQVDGKDVIIKKSDFEELVIGGNQFKRDDNYNNLAVLIEREDYSLENFIKDVNDGTYSYDKSSEYNTTIGKEIEEYVPESGTKDLPIMKILSTKDAIEGKYYYNQAADKLYLFKNSKYKEIEQEHEKYGYEKIIWDQFNTEEQQAIRDQAIAFKTEDPLPGAKTEEELKEEQSQETQELLEETKLLPAGVYQDDVGNIYRKGTKGGWQVKYNKAMKDKMAPIVSEFGVPSFKIEYDYDDDWTTLEGPGPEGVFDDPEVNIGFESTLTPYKGSLDKLPTIEEEEEVPKTRAQRFGEVGSSLLRGAGAALDAIGGPGAIVSYIMGKKGLKAAMKEVQPQASAELSPMFMQHLRQTRELAKKGFHPDQAQKFRKELDKSYQIGLENAVRGSGGQRAKFLAQSGVLDAQRSSALLDYAAKDEELQSKNAEKYEKMMLFKENFDIQRTEKERAEDMERQIADKKAAAGFTSAAFTNLLSGFGRSSLVPNPASGSTDLYNTIQNLGK